ncbi:unnamed protein product, partial [Rotaria magnacalcarata]
MLRITAKKGSHCEIELNPCMNNPCSHGNCIVLTPLTSSCICES